MSTITEALRALKEEAESEKKAKSIKYAKAFLDWLPFKLDGESVRKRMRKSEYGDRAIVEITHHNEHVGADFREEYVFYDDGTFTCIAEGYPSSHEPDNDFGEGFKETKKDLEISELFSVSRILSNVKDSGKIRERLPELIEAFAII